MNTHQKTMAFWGKYLLTALTLLSIFRVMFLIYHFPESHISINALFLGLLNGIRYDLSTIAYILLPIWVIHSIFSLPFFNKFNLGPFIPLIKIYSIMILVLCTTILVLDVGFFKEYYTRINYVAIEYFAFFGYIVDTIIIQFPYNILLLTIPILIFIEIKLFWSRINPVPIFTFNKYHNWAGTFLISAILMILFIRGGIQNRPLNWSHTSITPYRFTNQLSVNPVWNMGMTWKTAISEQSTDKYSNLNYPLEKAFVVARKSVQSLNDTFISEEYPLLRETKSALPEQKYNVVLILMEAFAGSYTGVLGDTNNITPNFDELSQKGVLFSRMFSSGTRTNRGLSSTLLSFPSLPRFKSILNDASIDQKFSSLAYLLKQRNYTTNFLVGGDLKYDNCHGFFLGQGYDNFYGRYDYGDKVFSTVWGVADEHLFQGAYNILNNSSPPTFMTILTQTNHPTYEFPQNDKLKPVNENLPDQMRMNAFKYSDWALGNFMAKCKSAGFYENTIFVILGDHGFISSDYNQNSSIELASYYIPCLIIAPGLDPAINSRTASQTDIVPTILDLLGGSFIHNSWGKNLLGEKMADDFAIVAPSGLNHLLGMITDEYFYIHNFSGEHQLFSLRNPLKTKQISEDISREKIQNQLRNDLIGYTLSAHYALNTYKCGININE